MSLDFRSEDGVRFVEGAPDQRLMAHTDDANLVLEACFSNNVRLALLYARNLTDGFFDLSTGEAGAILQKMRTYRVVLALVCPAGSVHLSSRFNEMAAEENRGKHFGLFETHQSARAWFGQLAAVQETNERDT